MTGEDRAGRAGQAHHGAEHRMPRRSLPDAPHVGVAGRGVEPETAPLEGVGRQRDLAGPGSSEQACAVQPAAADVRQRDR